jgi:hypothetical protein
MKKFTLDNLMGDVKRDIRSKQKGIVKESIIPIAVEIQEKMGKETFGFFEPYERESKMGFRVKKDREREFRLREYGNLTHKKPRHGFFKFKTQTLGGKKLDD